MTDPAISYVGTLVEINPTESTVSLENVKSHGTEGRKSDPADEVLGSSQIYEFIVFRGSDVKDLRVEETPAAPKENVPPPMPNDPAIVGVSVSINSITAPRRIAARVSYDEPFRMLKHTFV